MNKVLKKLNIFTILSLTLAGSIGAGGSSNGYNCGLIFAGCATCPLVASAVLSSIHTGSLLSATLCIISDTPVPASVVPACLTGTCAGWAVCTLDKWPLIIAYCCFKRVTEVFVVQEGVQGQVLGAPAQMNMGERELPAGVETFLAENRINPQNVQRVDLPENALEKLSTQIPGGIIQGGNNLTRASE